jgi:hypothetical protein
MYLRIFQRVAMNLQKNLAFAEKSGFLQKNPGFCRKIQYDYDILLRTLCRPSIPPFSPRNDQIFPAIYFALIGISDLAFGSQSDLLYVPT